jgi:CheY-like chemotaxis protein/HPt (histidine-containing phosphotransfer) domain-containing protein
VRLLLAEDNKVNQRVALSQLKKLGFTADAVMNGAMILNAMQDKAYDIILMDCQMPEMDGYEATRRIRQTSLSDQAPSPYIIALTANTLEGDRQRCLDSGMNDYLTKPIDMFHLEEVLDRALQHLNIDIDKAPRPEPSSSTNSLTNTDSPMTDNASKANPTLDLSTIECLRQLKNDQDLNPLADLIELYIKDATPRLTLIEKAIEEQNSSQVTAATHSLKGSSNNMGAKKLAALCGTLESSAKSNDLKPAPELLNQIKSEFALVKEALQRELQ